MHGMHFGIATRACDLSATTSNTTSLRHMHIHRAQERAWGFKESGLETVQHLGSGVGGSIPECQDHGCAHGRIIQHDIIHSSWVSAHIWQCIHAKHVRLCQILHNVLVLFCMLCMLLPVLSLSRPGQIGAEARY